MADFGTEEKFEVHGDDFETINDEAIYELIGADINYKDVLATVAKAGGEFAQSSSDADKKAATEKKAALQAGEAAFNTMKVVAEQAKWPQDISPQIVDLDKQWQEKKIKGSKDEIVSLIQRMSGITDLLRARAGIPIPGAMPPPAPPAPPAPTGISFYKKVYVGVPVWGWGVGLAVIGTGVYMVMKSRKQAY